MLQFRFRMKVFEGQRLVKEYVTPTYTFKTPKELADSLIRFAGPNARTYPGETDAKDAQEINLPPLDTGYGPLTCVVIVACIPV